MKSHSYRSAAIFSILLNFLSKGGIFLLNILVAYLYGVNSSTDIYFFLVTLILLVSNLILGVTGSVIIPEFIRRQAMNEPGAAVGFVNGVIFKLMILLAISAGILMINPVFLLSNISRFSPAVLTTHVLMIRLGLMVLILQSLVTLINELLVSRRYFVLPGGISILNSVLVIATLTLVSKTYGIKTIFVVNIVGLVLSLAFQMLILFRLEGWSLSFREEGSSSKLSTDFMYAAGTVVVSTIAAFFPIYLLSNFSGTLTEYNYSQRLAEIPISLLAVQFASVAAIKFNEAFAKNELSTLHLSFRNFGHTLLLILAPVASLIFLNSDKISFLLFARSAVSIDSLNNISSFISILIIATPFVGLSYLTTRVIMAARMVREGFQVQLIMTILNGLLVFTGVHFFTGIGYMWGYVIFQVIYSFSLYFFFKQALQSVSYASVLKNLVLVIGLCLTLSVVTNAFTFVTRDYMSDFLQVIVSTGIFLLLYFIAILLVPIQSANWVFNRNLVMNMPVVSNFLKVFPPTKLTK